MKIYDYKGRKNISGNRIREARLKKRLSQADLAARLQIAESLWSATASAESKSERASSPTMNL